MCLCESLSPIDGSADMRPCDDCMSDVWFGRLLADLQTAILERRSDSNEWAEALEHANALYVLAPFLERVPHAA